MKINEVSPDMLISYIREDPEQDDVNFYDTITGIMAAAKSYISAYTGLPLSAESAGTETINSYDDLTIAFLVLCQDMYDNRTMMPDAKYANSTNRTVQTILELHGGNLL